MVPKTDAIKTADETKTALMKALDPKSLGMTFDKVVKIGRNCVKLESEKSDLSTIPRDLLEKAGLTAKSQDKALPRLSILDVSVDLSPEQVKEAILAQNFDSAPLDILSLATSSLKVMFRFGPREKRTCHWILECDPVVRKFLLTSRRVYVGWNACRIQDHIRVARCYKCQKFGHNSSDFRSDTQCGHCAASHETRACPNLQQDPSCANCMRLGHKGAVIKHKASASSCPCYLKRVDSRIANTNYG